LQIFSARKMLDRQSSNFQANRLEGAIADRTAVIGVIGLGHIGLSLAAAVASAGFRCIGLDVDQAKISLLRAGRSYVDNVPGDKLQELLRSKQVVATGDTSELANCDVVILCVPTPLTAQRTPDLSDVETAARAAAHHLRPGRLVVLESTTYPGTTLEIVKPILESSGLRSGSEFFLGFAPERDDPGNRDYQAVAIPRVVSGDGVDAQRLIEKFYQAVVLEVVPVSSPTVAEAVKMTENVFRAVNIALVNELKLIYQAMGIDVWEVIEAASTKPFGFMPFYPGPGVGGHCVAIDPFYLAWKAKALDRSARFVELADAINMEMSDYVIDCVDEALNRRLAISLASSKLLIVGIAYKKNVADVRESPALRIMQLVEERGAAVAYHDPHVPSIPPLSEYPTFGGRCSIQLTPQQISAFDAVVLVTDHDVLDYQLIAAQATLVVDTRNAFARARIKGDHIVKA
jgi:UDP-N-acetyl-D-glucosamine dehydrogenase